MKKQIFHNNYLFLIFLLIFSLSIILRGYQEIGDTQAYVSFNYTRPPLVPIIFNIIKYIFGNLWGYVVVFLNVLLIDLFLICFYVFYKNKFYDFEFSFSFYFALIMLLIPYYIGNIGNKLASEGFSYPVCLFLYLYIFKSLIDNNVKHFLIVFIIFLFLFLTRYQFIFLLPGLFVYLIYFSLKLKNIKLYKSIIFFIIIIFSATLIERVYNYILHSEFSRGRCETYLITPAMFIASEADSNIFEEEIKKDFVISVTRELSQKKLSYNFRDEYLINVGELYGINVNPMFYETIQPNLNRKFNYLSGDILHYDFSKLEQVQEFTKEVSLKIIKNNFDKFFYLYYQNIKNWFGGTLYFYIFVIFFLFYFIYKAK